MDVDNKNNNRFIIALEFIITLTFLGLSIPAWFTVPPIAILLTIMGGAVGVKAVIDAFITESNNKLPKQTYSAANKTVKQITNADTVDGKNKIIKTNERKIAVHKANIHERTHRLAIQAKELSKLSGSINVFKKLVVRLQNVIIKITTRLNILVKKNNSISNENSKLKAKLKLVLAENKQLKTANMELTKTNSKFSDPEINSTKSSINGFEDPDVNSTVSTSKLGFYSPDINSTKSFNNPDSINPAINFSTGKENSNSESAEPKANTKNKVIPPSPHKKRESKKESQKEIDETVLPSPIIEKKLTIRNTAPAKFKKVKVTDNNREEINICKRLNF